MRSVLLLTTLLASSAVAQAAPPALCALPAATSTIERVSAQPSPVPEPQTSAPRAASTGAPKPGPTPSTSKLPPQLAALPFLRHVADSGAAITDLGTAHGLHSVAARTGDDFMIFQVLEDGSAAVSGPAVEVSPSDMARIAAGEITDLGVSHGFHGYFVRSGAHFQVFYETPDGERLIPGVLWDAAGKDITRQQVAQIPGAVPTVEVTDGEPGAPAVAVASVPLLEKAAYGLTGKDGAPRVYMLMDPQCVYSIRAMQMLRPYVDAGRLQLAIVPLSILDYEDHGASTQAALSLLSKPADQIAQAWQARDMAGAPSADGQARLRLNMQIAEALQAKGTPILIWRKADGGESRIDGLPTNVAEMLSSLGS